MLLWSERDCATSKRPVGRRATPMRKWPAPHRTVEDYRGTALDVRELYRRHVFDQPVGSAWRNCALTWPWLRSFRLDSASLELELRNGRRVAVPLVWAQCGTFNRYWLACPLCRRTVRLLYGIDERCACQRCAGLWHASRRKSAVGRKFHRALKIRQKLGGAPMLSAPFPPRPRYMHRRTYTRLRETALRLEAGKSARTGLPGNCGRQRDARRSSSLAL